MDTLIEIAKEEGLPPGAGDVLRYLKTLPLASADDLAGVMKRPVTGVLAHLRRLLEAGLVEAVQLGCTRRQRQRWYFTDRLLQLAGLTGVTWHEAHTRCRLLDLLPVLEHCYAAAGAVEMMGDFEQFQWLESRDLRGPTCDAAVRYSYGWIPLFWCGSLLSQSHISDRLARFPADCRMMAVEDPRPWPGLVCMIVMDEWERELVTRVLEDYEWVGQTVVRCVSDGTMTGPAVPRPSSGWLYQLPPGRPQRPFSWARSLAESPWAGAGGLEIWRGLEAVTQWPGCRFRFIRHLLMEGRGQHRVRESLDRLVDFGLIARIGDGRRARYFLTSKGLGMRARQDRVHASDARSRTGLSQWQEVSGSKVKRPVSPAHEDGLRALLAPLAAAGWPVANGTRFQEHLGTQGGIAPDAMVSCAEGPFGEGWAYVEYERSARRTAAVFDKLNGYGSSRRRDSYPIMLACWDDEAEAHFRLQGRTLGVHLATATLERLQEYGPLNPTQCWSI